jgi:hypothetical protein
MAGKGGLAIMIGLGKKKPGAAMDSEDDSEDGSGSAEDEAFQAAADAAKSGDGAAFKDAMKTAMELCYPSLAKGYSEGDSEEEG